MKVTCGCIAAVPKERALGPGEVANFRLRIDPSKTDEGPQKKYVSVSVLDKVGTQNIVLSVEADLIKNVIAYPPKITLGTGAKNAYKPFEFRLVTRGAVSYSVDNVESTGARMKVAARSLRLKRMPEIDSLIDRRHAQ